MVNEVEKWWDESSRYFQEENQIPAGKVHWGVHAPYEEELNLLGNVKGKRILEVGCGGGQNSMAKKGAICVGIDLSGEQLKFAEALAKKEGVDVEFVKGDFQKLGRYLSQTLLISRFQHGLSSTRQTLADCSREFTGFSGKTVCSRSACPTRFTR